MMAYILSDIEGVRALINSAKEHLRPGTPTIAVYVPIPERFLPLSIEVYGPLFVKEANAYDALQALQEPRGSKLVHHLLAAHNHFDAATGKFDLTAFAAEIGLPTTPTQHRLIEADVLPRKDGGAVLRLMDTQEYKNIIDMMLGPDATLDEGLSSYAAAQVQRGGFDTCISGVIPAQPLGWLFDHPGFSQIIDQTHYGSLTVLAHGENNTMTFMG